MGLLELPEGVRNLKELFETSRRRGVKVESQLERTMADESELFTTIGFKVVKVGRGRVELRFPFSRAVSRRGDMVHGGVVMHSLDNACGFAVMTVNPGVDQFTMELKVNFLKPLRKGPFRAIGKVVRAGSNVVVVEGEVRDADGSLCAKSLGSWYIIRDRP